CAVASTLSRIRSAPTPDKICPSVRAKLFRERLCGASTLSRIRAAPTQSVTIIFRLNFSLRQKNFSLKIKDLQPVIILLVVPVMPSLQSSKKNI
ncbi:hypothetical protein, partial [Thalassolituus oleivorans]|uniref:hypothetical protein n=1 Tax=Thalassolituus oleivorans TaxID=187493 RepID=UPI0023F4C1E9